MRSVKVVAPVAGYEGIVAGAEFTKGVAHVDPANTGALNYFRRAGYTVGDQEPVVAADPAPADPRAVVTEQVGTRLRDAAVDPRPGDFLAPTNAGKPGSEGNPHGPHVISPEVHASEGVRPVRGGPVAVDDVQAQDAAETAHTLDISPPVIDAVEVPADGTEATVAGDPPAASANKPEWVDFAVASGLDRSTAEAMTKAELVAAYGQGA